ncbi:hypothetical protein HNR46_000490 [Haloferula luteola]|uniref:3-keto-alpha-glucoside-1,2-lyase/3-keto-2-hydroxy-glucal hydratase domain-containing protein n=1 Tax=Haloferula luteola TaxID=595692 RepID=A0A840UZL0_9BACT|nr:DUF1080 domain-containing protein [Haloferula luteola]MBB5350266.1 hypothetical protein [Haloferula luteola]
MKSHRIASALALPLVIAPALADGAFYGDPPDATHPWAIHDMNRPQPPRVEPGTFSDQNTPGTPPSDAIVLFDGSSQSLSNWQADKNPPEATQWIAKDGVLQCVPGSGMIRTKEEFSDCQLHVEWASPLESEGNSQGRGNSGVFLMGEVEIQVLNNYDNPTYADGFAGSVYGVNPPMANALRKTGEWQAYDIVFRRPVYEGDQLVDPGHLTVFCNGVLLQDGTPLEGGGGHRARSHDRPFPETGPLKLQDHGNPVRFRNIWIRPLPKRAIEGGDTSVMTPEATAAKRSEIAQEIRSKAATKEGKDKLLLLLESLTYERDPEALKEASTMVAKFADHLKAMSEDKLEGIKGDVLQVNHALQYLTHFELAEFKQTDEILQLVKKREWDK